VLTPFERRCTVVDENGARQKPVLVFYIGGVTFAEISALRFVSTQGEGEHAPGFVTTPTRVARMDCARVTTIGCGAPRRAVNRDIIIGTTKLISGSSMLDTLMAAPIRPIPAEQEGTVG
jgi:hypothetical protein